ncbi:MAG: hypothetical protein GY894_05755 [Planctomycetes bacterium]|jgi:hypothetical protein|nr:hypothetical protein [Planctomycetota bacterium]
MTSASKQRRKGLPGPLHLLENVWFGIFLLTLLFVYCSIGSAGIPVSLAFWEPTAWYPLREHQLLEMTEYEWFNWWPFYTLVGLTCLNMAVVTTRWIPLTAVNAGVWMVHGGIIIMCLGCVIYFGTKVEGDVAVARGRLMIETPDGQTTSLLAMPGASATVGSSDKVWSFRVASIDPEWSLLSGEDAGKQAYAVTVSVEGPEQSFMRQVIAGYPEYTEDIIPSENHQQPMSRAKNVLGEPLVNKDLSLTMVPDRRDTFYLQAHSSIYLREVSFDDLGRTVPKTPWIERPIGGMPRFHDRIGAAERVWTAAGEAIEINPLDMRVTPVNTKDPLAGTDVVLSDYLRYALLQPRAVPISNGPPSPWALVTLSTPDGRSQTHEVMPIDVGQSTAPADQLSITWVDKDLDLEPAAVPRLHIRVPESDVDITVPITVVSAVDPDLEMTPIEGTPFSWRVQRFDDGLFIADHTVSMARVEINDGKSTWMRWVFDDPSMNADMALEGSPSHEGNRILDERLTVAYLPPVIGRSTLELIAGPARDRIRIRVSLPGQAPRVEDVVVGTPIDLARGITMTVNDWSPSVRVETRPTVVPKRQRDLAAANQFSMVRAVVPGQVDQVAWLPMHHYPFESRADTVLGFKYSPTTIQLPDGRLIEMMLSRSSHPLPADVSLDGFRIATHVGGFTGSVSSVLNWHSQVRFEDSDGDVEIVEVSVNDPKPKDGLWFFQSQWDPPDPSGSRGGVPSAGRNFTVLGVGNRNGVWTMLAGCVLSVVGMIYAFYIKPMIKRRATLAVYQAAGEVTS